MRRGTRHTPESKAKVSAANRGRVRSPEFKARVSEQMKGNRYNVGRQNALKVTPSVLRKIERLKKQGLGCRRIARAVGLNKTTILNVFNGKHRYG